MSIGPATVCPPRAWTRATIQTQRFIAGCEHGASGQMAIVHLLTTATIDHLRELYPKGRFEARHFRPNIVFSTGSDVRGFVENDWIERMVALATRSGCVSQGAVLVA